MRHPDTSFTKAVLSAICILLVVGLTSCDFSGFNQAVDDFGVVIELEPIHTSSSVLVKDANTGELINQEVEVSFAGSHGDQVIDMFSEPMPDKTLSSGILTFGISNSVKPTVDSPAEVTLQVHSDGYLSTSRTVSIEHEGSNPFSVELIRKDNPPSGVEITTNTDGQANSDGTVQQNFNVQAISKSSSTSSQTQASNVDYGFEMEITEGTVFKDRNGNPLTGQLAVEVTYYNPLDKEAMKSVPMDMKTEDGNRILTYGMIAMEITDSKGKVAASVSSGSPSGKFRNGDSRPTVQGYLENAMVCIDANFNSECEEGEAMTPTNSSKKGRYRLTRSQNAFKNAPTLVRNTPDVTDDPNDDNSPSEVPNLQLRAPKNAQVVTPLTTLVQSQAEEQLNKNNKSNPDLVYAKEIKEAKRQVEMELDLGDQPDVLNTDYVANTTFEGKTTGYNARKETAAKVRETADAVNKLIASTRMQLPPGKTTVTVENELIGEIHKEIDNIDNGVIKIEGEIKPGSTIEMEANLKCEDSDVRVRNLESSVVHYRLSDAAKGDSWNDAALKTSYDDNSGVLTGNFTIFAEVGKTYTFKTTYESKTYDQEIMIDSKNVTYTETVSDESACM